MGRHSSQRARRATFKGDAKVARRASLFQQAVATGDEKLLRKVTALYSRTQSRECLNVTRRYHKERAAYVAAEQAAAEQRKATIVALEGRALETFSLEEILRAVELRVVDWRAGYDRFKELAKAGEKARLASNRKDRRPCCEACDAKAGLRAFPVYRPRTINEHRDGLAAPLWERYRKAHAKQWEHLPTQIERRRALAELGKGFDAANPDLWRLAAVRAMGDHFEFVASDIVTFCKGCALQWKKGILYIGELPDGAPCIMSTRHRWSDDFDVQALCPETEYGAI